MLVQEMLHLLENKFHSRAYFEIKESGNVSEEGDELVTGEAVSVFVTY